MNNELKKIIFENSMKRESLLSEYACKSSESQKLHKESKQNDIRLTFSKDTDRIIHSLSYSRYIDKTQVFSYLENDNISRRMTHVQFVSKIARTIGRALKLNEDLIEAISLGHDIGHVPFGHVGEYILNDISLIEGEGMFMHNIQSVRTFMYVEKNGIGINLSLQVLDGIMCHNGELLQEKYYPKQKTWDILLKEYCSCYNNKEVAKKLTPMTLEGCVVRISDIIGYIGRDIEDAINLGVISRDDLPEEFAKVLGKHNKDIINTIVLDIIENSYDKPYISMSKEIYNALVNLKKFNYENIYFKATSEDQKKKYIEMFNTVFKVYLYQLDKNLTNSDIFKLFLDTMDEEYIKGTSNKRKVIDFISGMTDSFFESQYEKIKNS